MYSNIVDAGSPPKCWYGEAHVAPRAIAGRSLSNKGFHLESQGLLTWRFALTGARSANDFALPRRPPKGEEEDEEEHGGGVRTAKREAQTTSRPRRSPWDDDGRRRRTTDDRRPGEATDDGRRHDDDDDANRKERKASRSTMRMSSQAVPSVEAA